MGYENFTSLLLQAKSLVNAMGRKSAARMRGGILLQGSSEKGAFVIRSLANKALYNVPP
jgi:hypothetical protein